MKNKKNDVSPLKPTTKPEQLGAKVALKNAKPEKTLKPKTTKPDSIAKPGSDANKTEPEKPPLTE